MICEKCGKELLEGMILCGYCGTLVSAGKTESEDDLFEGIDCFSSKGLLEKEYYKEFFNYDRTVVQTLQYDKDSELLNIRDKNGNTLFSAECDRPEIDDNSFHSISKTYFFEDAPYTFQGKQFIFYRRGKWKIYDLKAAQHISVTFTEDDEEIFLSEFDSIVKTGASFEALYRYSNAGKLGFFKLIRLEDEEEMPDDSEEPANDEVSEAEPGMPVPEIKLTSVANCVYDKIDILNFEGSTLFKAVNDKKVSIICEFGVVCIFYAEEGTDQKAEDIIQYVDANKEFVCIAIDSTYLAYKFDDIERYYADITPSEEYSEEPIGLGYEQFRIIETVSDSCGLYILEGEPPYSAESRMVMKCGKTVKNIEGSHIEAIKDELYFIVKKSGFAGVFDHCGKIIIPQCFIHIEYREKPTIHYILTKFKEKFMASIEHVNDEYNVDYKEITSEFGAQKGELEDIWSFNLDDFKCDNNVRKYLFDREMQGFIVDEAEDSGKECDNDFGDTLLAQLTGSEDDENDAGIDLTQNMPQTEQDIVFGYDIAIFKDNGNWKIYDGNYSVYLYEDIEFSSFKRYGNILIYESNSSFGAMHYNKNRLEMINKQQNKKIILKKVKYSNNEIFLFCSEGLKQNSICGKNGLIYTFSLVNTSNFKLHYFRIYGQEVHLVYYSNPDEETYIIFKINEISWAGSPSLYVAGEYDLDHWTYDYNNVLCKSKGSLMQSHTGTMFSPSFMRIRDGVVSQLGSYLGKIEENWYICERDGCVGVIGQDERVIIPFRYSMINKIDLEDHIYGESYLLLNEFGKKGVAKFEPLAGRVTYILACDYESVYACMGSNLSPKSEDMVVSIDQEEVYFEVKKMGRYAYYNLNGMIAVHFVKSRSRG